MSANITVCRFAVITDKLLKNGDDFVWAIEVPLTGKFIIDVEFLDLKNASPDVSISTHLCLPCYVRKFH